MANISEKHEHVDPQSIQVARAPDAAPVGVGVQPAVVQTNPDYNGYRVKADDSPKIYLVLFGLRRWIIDPDDYNHLFRDWGGVLRFPKTSDLDAIIPESESLTPGVRLAKGQGSAPIYLITDTVRMWVTSPAVMDKYWFSWDQVVVVPDVVIGSIPLGPALS